MSRYIDAEPYLGCRIVANREDGGIAVDEIKTVDAVSVAHGKWIKRNNEMKCSKCKFIYYSNNDPFNYCPNCGAKMDGERSRE